MIKLILSTPRSGSHFYSELVQKEDPSSIVMHEVLTRAYKDIYLKMIGDIELSSTVYSDDSYYEDLYDGTLIKRFNQRPSKQAFFDQLLHSLIDPSKTYILHEHVSLIPKEWIVELIKHASSVSYLHRNRKEQIASRVVAGHTGVYIVRQNYMLCHGNLNNIDAANTERFNESISNESFIKNLVSVYDTSDSLMRELNVPFVSYESLTRDSTASTKQIFKSSFDRLCDADQAVINNVLGCD